MAIFICPYCGNDDERYIGIKNGEYYCRRCLSMKSDEVIDYAPFPPQYAKININYPLTIEQDKVAKKVSENYVNKKNTLIYAVCGAGKTELVFDVIKTALSRGQQIGFTIPRREVVIEIYSRLVGAFPHVTITLVHGGNTANLRGQIIVLTTHQLYRYKHFFDLLIFDEIDAFPYAGDFVLEKMFMQSVRGHYVILSATPSQTLMKAFRVNGEILTLFTRFHHHQMPVPTTLIRFFLIEYLTLYLTLKKLLSRGKSVLVFAPTISWAETLYFFLRLLLKGGELVHSKREKVGEIITRFKRGEHRYLVTTTVLERGITIKGLQVIIFHADHTLFDQATLVQISGRVGRKKDEPDGHVIFIAQNESDAMKGAINDIKDKNTYLQTVYEQATDTDTIDTMDS